MNAFKNNIHLAKKEEATDKEKNTGRLEVLIWFFVFLIGFVGFPRSYKGLSLLLPFIPIIPKIINKIRQSKEMPDRTPPTELYYHKPKDPKDPRRYKPIG